MKKPRLVDANVLITDLLHLGDLTFDAVGVANFISHAPAIDAVEVVRCKDCKHCMLDIITYTGRHTNKNWCGKKFIMVESDDFCNHGERRK